MAFPYHIKGLTCNMKKKKGKLSQSDGNNGIVNAKRYTFIPQSRSPSYYKAATMRWGTTGQVGPTAFQLFMWATACSSTMPEKSARKDDVVNCSDELDLARSSVTIEPGHPWYKEERPKQNWFTVRRPLGGLH